MILRGAFVNLNLPGRMALAVLGDPDFGDSKQRVLTTYIHDSNN